MGKGKRFLALVLASLLLFGGVLPQTARAADTGGRDIQANLLQAYNTDFEGTDPNANGKLYWWNNESWNSTGLTQKTYAANETRLNPAGSHYMEVAPDGNGKSVAQINDAGIVTALPCNASYEFSFYAKAPESAENATVTFSVTSVSSDWKSQKAADVRYDSGVETDNSGAVVLTKDWKFISGTFTIPSHDAHINVPVKFTGSDGLTFYLDDLKIGALATGGDTPTGENLVKNPNFADAANLTVWTKGAAAEKISTGTVSGSETIGNSGITTYGKIASERGQYDCFAQDVTAVVKSGKSYDYSFWVKLDETDYTSAAKVEFGPFVTVGEDTTYWGSYSEGILDSKCEKVIEPGTWTQFKGVFSPKFTGEATEVVIRILEQSSGKYGAYYVTGVELRERAAQEEPKKEIEWDIRNLKDTVSSDSGLGADAYTGTAFQESRLTDKTLMDLVTKHFNAITLENELKVDAIFNYQNDAVPADGFEEVTWKRANGKTVTGKYPKMDFSRAEKMLDVIKAWNDEHTSDKIKVRGHVLVWHSQTPEWFFHEDWDKTKAYVSKDEMDIRQEWYIKHVLEHFFGETSKYKDMFYGWDVVNEAVSDGGGYRTDKEVSLPSSWWKVYQSEEFIVNAFRYANKYAPADLELYYNDYNECNSTKMESIAVLLKAVKAHENDSTLPTRITGMGMQSHHGTESTSPTVNQIKTAAITYGKIVGKVQLTELDLKASKEYDGTAATQKSEYTKQAYRYKEIYDVLKEVDAMEGIDVNGITIWGVIDKYSWLQSSSSVGGGADGTQKQAPLLFDDDYKAKPAFYAFVDPSKLEPFINNVVAMQALEGSDPYAKSNVYTINGANASFQMVWDQAHLKVKVTVEDAQAQDTDGVTLYLDWNKTGAAVTPVKKTVTRAEAQATTSGYIAEFTVDKPLTVGSSFAFDVVVTNGGEKSAFNDLTMAQEGSSKYYANAMTKPYMSINAGAVTVDGTQDEAWAKADAVPLTIKTGSTTAAAQAKLLWDETNLYVWVEVTDSVLDKSSTQTHEQDSVEVFLDENNAKTEAYQEDDKQYRINYENEQSFNGTKCKAENVTSAAKETDSGYIVEAAFKWTDITPKTGMEIGLEIQINDGAGGTRIGTLSWFDESGMGWSSPAVFGTALLTGSGTPTTPSNPGTPSTPSTPTAPPVTTDKTTENGKPATETTVKPSAAVKDGTATAAVSSSVGDEIVKQAEKNKSDNVVIAPEVKGDVSKSEVSIPAKTVEQIGSKTEASLTVSTPVADVTIPNEALGDLSKSGGSVKVTAERTGNAVELTVKAGSKTVDSIPGGMKVTVPAEEKPTPGTVAVLVKEDGTRQVIRKSTAGENGVTIPLDGSAKIEIVDNSKQFSDVPETNWASGAVVFASSHELFSGTSDTTFSPEVPMSRGMLAVVLHNLESNPAQALTGTFGDVDNSKWYAEGISWAAEKGIINGYDSGKFGPDDDVTREQVAVMLWRYAGSPAATGNDLDFADADKTSSWALEAMRWATENGIINGKGNGILDPGGQATRAQTAQMLKNFMERL